MARSLLITGAGLMVLGFLQGLVPDYGANRGLWISAHVAAIQNGLILVVLGGVWRGLSRRTSLIAGTLCVLGLYGLWVGLIAAALLGLVSPNHSVVTSGVQTIASYSLILGFLFVIWGFFRANSLGR